MFIRRRKLNISLGFVTQSYIKVPKDVGLNTTHFLISKIPNKIELKQIALNHSSDIGFEDFINIYRKCTAEPCSFIVNDTTLASDNLLRFRENIFNTLIKIMTINYQIRDEKLQYDVNREAAKISAWSSCKICKYKYLTGEDILPSNQQEIIEQAKFTYCPLRKGFEKQVKTIEDQGQKQIDAFKEQTKPIEDKFNNLSRSSIIFNNYINERKNIMSKLYDSVDCNNLKFEYVGPTKDVSFYEYMDSKKLFNKINNGQIRFSEAKNK